MTQAQEGDGMKGRVAGEHDGEVKGGAAGQGVPIFNNFVDTYSISGNKCLLIQGQL